MIEALPPASVSVIVCAYTLDRFALTERCLRSVLSQEPAPSEVIAVIDHNDDLAVRLAAAVPEVTVVANAGPRGLSGARNTGIERSSGEIVAFIDDDAVPEPGWLSGLLATFHERSVIVAGGRAEPTWERPRPGWFPAEFLWVVGCSFLGQVTTGDVRNPIGCNMAFRRTVFDRVGGFDASVGRLGTLPIGAEETELCIRARRSFPDGRVRMTDAALVRHWVPAARGRLSYFLRRCFYEGVSKSVVRRLSDPSALATEQSYVARTLTRGIAGRITKAIRLDRPTDQIGQSFAVVLGTALAATGYVIGTLRARRPSRVRDVASQEERS